MAEVSDNDGVSSRSSPLGINTKHNFDFINWFYWTIWWQQCSYYFYPQYWTGHTHIENSNTSPDFVYRHPSSQISGIGYETIIAPLWKRLMAELIDMFLFGLILKFYIPDFEYRVPEIIFESNDVWKDISEDELLEIRSLVMHFLVSTVIQRMTHAVFETLFLSFLGWTPGKWLLGLRLMKCVNCHLTRTIPGASVRVEPGGKVSIINAALRSLFKGTVSAFIPLIIFFFNISHGRTRYDKLFGSIVVDVSHLHRPNFVNGQGFNQMVNLNLNQRGQVRVQIR